MTCSRFLSLGESFEELATPFDSLEVSFKGLEGRCMRLQSGYG
jgi:hypothetical protein